MFTGKHKYTFNRNFLINFAGLKCLLVLINRDFDLILNSFRLKLIDFDLFLIKDRAKSIKRSKIYYYRAMVVERSRASYFIDAVVMLKVKGSNPALSHVLF